MGRPRKYTPEQLKVMKRIWSRQAKQRHRAKHGRKKTTFHPLAIDIVAVRPPYEVLMERDYRFELLGARSVGGQIFGDPPLGYAAAYTAQAWGMQQWFATH